MKRRQERSPTPLFPQQQCRQMEPQRQQFHPISSNSRIKSRGKLPLLRSFMETERERERENKVKKEVYMADQETVRLEKLETTTENKFLKF